MSYCRFSSDNWKSDVYVYADCSGGYTIHTASNRPVVPPIPSLPMQWARFPWLLHIVWLSYRLHMLTVRFFPRRSIKKKQAGRTFKADTASEAASMLLTLQHHGFYVPRYAIDELLEEAKSEGD